MNLLSFHFWMIVGFSFILYWILPAKCRWLVLTISSYYFIYKSNRFSMFIVTILMFFATWLGAIVISQENLKKNLHIRKAVLGAAIVFDLGCLIGIKHIYIPVISTIGLAEAILAPIGISYFTLTLLGYILDVYWEVAEPQKNYLKFSAFVGYFPCLISGPIIKYSNGIEIVSEKSFSYKNFCYGCQRILWGFFKKLVISERVSVIVNTVYGNVALYKGIYIWIAMLCFVVQMYTDFSGCIDIVLGISQIFGIELPENFELPFLSENLSEFWRRWHITLGEWLKNYILYPNPDKPEKFVLQFPLLCYSKEKGGFLLCYLRINTLIKFMASLPVMTA